MADKDSKQGDDVWGTLLAIIAGIVVFAFLLPPAILAAVAWWFTRDRITRKEYVVLVGASAVALIIAPVYATKSYFPWLWQAYTGHFSWSGVPVFTTICIACFLFGMTGMLLGTRLTQRLPARFRSKIETPVRTTVLPTDEEKARVHAVVPAPGSAFLIPEVSNDPEGSRRFQIGVGADAKPLMLSEEEMGTHVMLLGSTGSGKTETIKTISGNLLDLGWSGMILDLKEDAAGLRSWCEIYATAHKVPYQELCSSAPESTTWFNPLAGLGPDEMRDTILALQGFDDEHWANINKEMLGQLVNLMVWANQVDPIRFPAPTMYEMGKIFTSGSLAAATKKMRAVVLQSIPGIDEASFNVLANPGDKQKSADGFGAKLTQIFQTQAGRTVLSAGPTNSRKLIDVTAPGLTYIGLDSLGKKDLTLMMSSAVLQRMSAYAAARTTDSLSDPFARSPRFLIVDEANWVNRIIVQNILSRARSAGIACMLCTQGPLDWIDKMGDDWGKMVNNINVALVMKQQEPESALKCADLLGEEYKMQKRETIQVSRGLLFDKQARNASGDLVESRSLSEELQHSIEPYQIRALGKGEVILRATNPVARLEWGKITMRDPLVGPTPWQGSTVGQDASTESIGAR